MVLGLFVLLASQSFGALIFAGNFTSGAADAIRSALLAAAIGGAITLWRNGGSGLLTMPQDRTAPILAMMAAQLNASLPADSAPEARLATVMVAIALTSLLTGAGLWLLGRFQLGNLIRFIPFPVVAGFLAGSGWLLLDGAIKVMTGVAGTLHQVGALFTAGMVLKWLPGIALGGLTFFLVNRTRRPVLLPLMLLGAFALFWVIELALGHSTGELRQTGWLSAASVNGDWLPGLWRGVASGTVNWQRLPGLWALAGTVLLTAVISILLNASALELLLRKDIDYNCELRAAGVGNLVASLGGGMVSFQSLNLSRLGHELGAGRRAAGLVCAGVCAFAWFAGLTPMALVPKFVLGGLLCFLSLGLLKEWLVDAWRRLPISDYLVVLLIVFVIATLGFVLGVLVGTIAAVVLFVHNYSRVEVITHTLDGTEQRSNVDRPPQEHQWLQQKGGHVYVLRLQGYLFFGTANRLLDDLRARATASNLPQLLIVALDFHRVSGVDTSATFSLAKVQVLAGQLGFKVALTGLSPQLLNQLGSLKQSGGTGFATFGDLDRGMEWCEEQLLANDVEGSTRLFHHPMEQLRRLWPNRQGLERFLQALQRVELSAGQLLIQEGDPADSLYVIESGHVSTVVQTAKGPQRLQRQSPGTIVGEIGFLLGVRRTASVWTESDCVLHKLDLATLERLKHSAPDVVAELYQTMAHLLAARVVKSNQLIRRLSE